MRRREFLALIGTVAASPVAAQPRAMRRIGFLQGGASDERTASSFKEGLAALGWIEGQNVALEWRAARGGDPRALAAELIAWEPDVLVVSTTPALRALQHATTTIPIVFVVVSDPVRDGFVESLARPGRNITGFSNYDPALSGKWIELLREASPGLRRIAILYNPDTAPHSLFLAPLLATARSLGVPAVETHVRTDDDIARVLAAFAAEPGGAVLAMPDSFIGARTALLASIAKRHRLPSLFPFRFYVERGGLLSYGADIADQYRHAASYVDRILRGASPAELPVQAPTKFELFLNLRTANEIGLELPPSLLARADEVIE